MTRRFRYQLDMIQVWRLPKNDGPGAHVAFNRSIDSITFNAWGENAGFETIRTKAASVNGHVAQP